MNRVNCDYACDKKEKMNKYPQLETTDKITLKSNILIEIPGQHRQIITHE